MRADAQRNYDRIVAAASEAVARDGAEASLEEIARRAGVGSATLHRHFPARRDLLNAVFHERVVRLCARAGELEREPDAYAGLVTWLRELGTYAASTRGLAASLLSYGPLREDDTCHGMLLTAADGLRRRADRAGAVRPDVATADLLTLVNAISQATEGTGPEAADRLITLALDGVRTHPVPAHSGPAHSGPAHSGPAPSGR